jgi:hypothetical protein
VLDETELPMVGVKAWELVRWMYQPVGDEEATAEEVATQLTACGVPLTLRTTRSNPNKRGDVRLRPDGRWTGGRALHLLNRPHLKGHGVMRIWEVVPGADPSRRPRRVGMMRSAMDFSVPAIVDEALWERTQHQIGVSPG